MENLSTRRNNQFTVEFSGQTESLADYFFGFSSEEALQTPECSGVSGADWDKLEEDDSCQNSEQRKAFWESQEQLIQSILYRTTAIETHVRQETRKSLLELRSSGFQCRCRSPAIGDCRNCLRDEVCNALIGKGFRCSICKSKWRRSSEILAGEHIFLEVVDGSNPKKGDVRVIIELNFRAEFEMARSGEEYKQLISRLPEYFIGKEDRLRSVIKALCVATKRCMEEMKIHIGPWRKHKYMQAKWMGKCQRSTPMATPAVISGRPERAGSSLLTCDLGNKLSGLHCTAVEVS